MKLTRENWDQFDGYLFDLDGTLLHCRDAVHYFAFLDCLQRLSGRALTLEGVLVHGSTDPKIIADALTRAGLSESVWRPQLPSALAAMVAQVTLQRDQMQVECLPGARRVLQHLQERGAQMSVATGNLEEIGWLKLEACGLREFFDFGCFSDTHEHRTATLQAARQKMLACVGENASICVVGDTPMDIQSAHENCLPVIAVATGIFSREELLAAKPDLCVDSLQELVQNNSVA